MSSDFDTSAENICQECNCAYEFCYCFAEDDEEDTAAAAQGPIVIRATVQMDFVFDPAQVDGRTPEEIIQEWFINEPRGRNFDMPHAARDAGKIHGGSRIVQIEHLPALDYPTMIVACR